ncbi:MAG TPA: acyltransferase [Bacteroidales bacterium]|nr:acyltransferase [Bacteroidales bacterium]
MRTKPIAASAYSDSKPHYEILNGLRGVAALMVIFYHIFEAFATSPFDQKFNHGYLAVDFFFVLSGFVIAYAYDDRWGKMSTKDFFKRRLIRLHPLIVIGFVFGAITFLIQGSVKWNGSPTPLSMVMLATLLSLFLIPAYPGAGYEVRGNAEMFPLNGPTWSLFFEYIGNILYAIMLRRINTKALATLVLVSGVGLAYFSISGMSGYGHLGVGWSLADNNFLGGMLRVIFSFSIGQLLSRTFKPIKIRGAFWFTSLVIVVLLAMPYVTGEATMWINGIYDAVVVIFVFPFLVFLGASGKTTDKFTTKMCKFMGDISYPLYIVHYPFMYLFYAWIWKNGYTFAQTWHVAVLLIISCILLAYLVLKLYDIPVRRYLTKKFMKK